MKKIYLYNGNGRNGYICIIFFYRGYKYLGDGNLSFIRYILYIYYTSYFLLFKKSYNLLAGMTEEELERIQENIEVKMKYDKH